MSLLNFSKNCDIITNSFCDDLKKYKIANNSLVWEEEDNSSLNISPKIDIFNNISNAMWLPEFVKDDDLVDNMIISNYGPIIGDSNFPSGRIGYEDYFTFAPRFNNWNVTNGVMSVDWILNRARFSHHTVAGLLYWKRAIEPIIGAIEIFPPYSKIKHNNIEYIKLDNNTLKNVSFNPNAFINQGNPTQDSAITFNYTENTNANTVSISSLTINGTAPSFTLIDSSSSKIWIPDGDQLFYFDSSKQKTSNYASGLQSKSYISGSLYKYYNVFYNSLTAQENLLSINSSRDLKKLRAYKKLAHCLSTSPFIGEFFINFLAKPSNVIKSSIEDYINTNINNLDSDINALTTVLTAISDEYSKYEINNNSNIVTNNNELFIKLINKYGAKLKLSNNSTVTYNKNLDYGDNIIIEEIGDTLVTKNITGVVSNNKTIRLNNIAIQNNNNQEQSEILLQKIEGSTTTTTNKIFLYNSAKPNILDDSNIDIIMDINTNARDTKELEAKNKKFKLKQNDPASNVFFWTLSGKTPDNMDSWLTNFPKLSVLNLNLQEKYTDGQNPRLNIDFVQQSFVCTWTKVSGPNLRFVDLNKTQTNKNYNIAYGNEVAIVPYSTGKYVIKCVVSGPFGTYTKFKTIFIVDSRPTILQDNDIVEPRGQFVVPNPFLNSYGSDNILDFPEVVPLSTVNNILRTKLPEDSELLSLNESPIPIVTKNLQVFIAGLNSIAIGAKGLFAPIKTDYLAERVSAADRSIEKLDTNYVFDFNKDAPNMILPRVEDSILNIIYSTNNTIIKLDRIILRNIRNNKQECSQCYSLYKPKFKSFIGSRNRRPSFNRSNKFNDGFTLQKYLYETDTKFNRSSLETYFYPQISNDLAPAVKTYGGYGKKVLNQLSIRKIYDHEYPTDNNTNNIIASDPNVIPSVTGYKLDYIDEHTTIDDSIKKYKVCYQNTVAPSGFIEFKKGYFAPNSGWVNDPNKHLSSVLKFNPGARKSFSFTGPGILGLSNYATGVAIDTSVFTSSIELEINPSIRWYDEPVGEEPGQSEQAQIAQRRKLKTQHDWENQIKKELSDQLTGYSNDYHHGYRILNGGNPKRPERNLLSDSSPENDEFDFSINESNNKFIYGFNTVGPNNPVDSFSEQDRTYIQGSPFGGVLSKPQESSDDTNEPPEFDTGQYIDSSSGWPLKNPRVNKLIIKDIEVKLNFLNYVNTKNLAIWLEVDFIGDSREKRDMSFNAGGSSQTPFAPPQIKSTNNFIDQFIASDTYKGFAGIQGLQNRFKVSNDIPVSNIMVKNYLTNLTDTNSVDNIGEKLILYLLNQETIQNKEYNFSVKFSDSANKHNTFFDHNMFSSGIVNPDQNIISNNMSINPSKNTFNYNTYNNSNFSNLIKLNRLNINNNTFHKFANKRLFAGRDPQENSLRPKSPQFGGPYDVATVFTLCIAVLEEPDEMFPMDNIINNDLYTNLASIENKISSANLFNNLCSWELILHTEDVKKPVTAQIGSLADYGGADALSVLEYGEEPKYPGYSFIADLSDSKFLLPLTNINAPTTYYQNYNACEYADNELIGKGTLINGPRFPTEALLLILAGTAVGGMTGTLVGTLIGSLGPTYSLGFQMLFDYFKESRKIPLLELIQREVFDMDYEGYPFGNSDKILLNISQDGFFWYKVEASIFKLSNTPALPLKEYSLIKADNKLFRFNFSIVSNRSDIIDELFVPYIVSQATPPVSDPPTAEELKTINNYQSIDNSVYDDFDFMNVNELVFFNKIIHEKNIFQSLGQSNQTLIIIDHSIPYYLINIGDSVILDCNNSSVTIISKALMYKESRYQTVLAINQASSILSECSSLLLPEDVIVVCGKENSTTESGLSSPVSLFGLVNDQPPYDSIPDLNFSTNSLGSYGDGSSVKEKNILSRKVKINSIDPIYSQLNSFNNDKFYYNQLSITLPSGTEAVVMAPNTVPTGTPISIKNKLSSYPVYYDSTTNNIINNNFYHIYNNTFNDANAQDNTESIRNLIDNINSSVKDYRTYSKDYKYNMCYLKVPNDTINSLYRNTLAVITIENNYSYIEKIHRITQEQLTTLTTRLDLLNTVSIPSLDNKIGVANQTNAILNSNSIHYIQEHYTNLPDDETNCSRLLPVITCYKQNTYSKLQKLYSERNSILKLLENQTIRKAKIFLTAEDFDTTDQDGNSKNQIFIEGFILYDNPVSIKLSGREILQKENIFKIIYSYILDPEKQKYHTETGGIIPDFKANIISESDGAIRIDYEKFSDNYYWINIDPKQSISIAEEMRPRILKSVKYICQSVNPSFSTGGSQILSFNNICPDWRDIEGKTGDGIKIKADSTGTTYIFYNHDYNPNELSDPNIPQERLTYIVESMNRLNAAKKAISPSLTDTLWREQILTRRFRINSDNDIAGLSSNQEFLVTAVETYEIALTVFEEAIENGRKNNLTNNQIIAQLLTDNLIKNDYSGDILIGGLLNGLDSNPEPRLDGSRNNFPNRVYNIFNLDSTPTLKVQFRKVPRSLRGIDAIGSVLRYGENMSYKPQNRPPLDPLDIFGVGRTESLINNFYEWKCLQLNQNRDGIEPADTPDFFKLLNEMIFRAFFGSVDEIENKNSTLKSLYDFEMIPYEYFTGPPQSP